MVESHRTGRMDGSAEVKLAIVHHTTPRPSGGGLGDKWGHRGGRGRLQEGQNPERIIIMEFSFVSFTPYPDCANPVSHIPVAVKESVLKVSCDLVT